MSHLATLFILYRVVKYSRQSMRHSSIRCKCDAHYESLDRNRRAVYCGYTEIHTNVVLLTTRNSLYCSAYK